MTNPDSYLGAFLHAVIVRMVSFLIEVDEAVRPAPKALTDEEMQFLKELIEEVEAEEAAYRKGLIK